MRCSTSSSRSSIGSRSLFRSPFGGSHTAGLSEWHGIGFVAGLLVIALLLWEAVRLFEVERADGLRDRGSHVSVGLALALALFTVIAFFDKSTARHWPAWIGLLLSLVIAVVAVVRARAEGVQLPQARATDRAAEPTAPAQPAAAPAEPAAAPTQAAAPAEPAAEPEAPAAPEQ